MCLPTTFLTVAPYIYRQLPFAFIEYISADPLVTIPPYISAIQYILYIIFIYTGHCNDPWTSFGKLEYLFIYFILFKE